MRQLPGRKKYPQPIEVPLERIPAAPEGMNQVASKIWKKKCQDLKESGRLTSRILETLQTFCNLLSDMQRAREMMDRAWGQDVFYRYQKSYHESAKIQLSYARELGFVSSKEAPVQITKKERPEFLQGLED
jgi:phage terminase small subunit